MYIIYNNSIILVICSCVTIVLFRQGTNGSLDNKTLLL